MRPQKFIKGYRHFLEKIIHAFNSTRVFALIATVLLLGGCSSISLLLTQEPNSLPSTITPTFSHTETLTSTPLPTKTKNNTPTPTQKIETPATPTPKDTLTPPPVDSTCILSQPHDPFLKSKFEDYPARILAFLNASGTVQELDEILTEYEIANPPITVTAGDLTGNGKLDVVVSFINSRSQGFPKQGALLIYTCQGDHYILAYYEIGQQGFDPPSIIHIQDLNSDGPAELISSSAICGAYTCFEDVKIIAWTGTGFENRLNGTIIDLPFPNVQITDYEKDGIYQLEAAGSGPGTISAGPPREKTRIYTYNPNTGFWELTDELIGASDFRIHVLHDADDAARRSEYLIAQVLYDRVINDSSLIDWRPEDFEEQVINLQAYARFKLVVVYAFQNQLDNAQSILEAMLNLYPQDQSQYAYAQLAQVFLNAYTTQNKEAACGAAHEYAALHAVKILTPLGQEIFGATNPNYSPLDICP
jgi:hypothetical protein